MPATKSKAVYSKVEGKQPHWFATSPSKRWAELFYLYYSAVWISVFGTVVVTKVYESFRDVEFFILGLVVSLPCVIIPLLFPGEADKGKPLRERYWVKANIWIAIFGFIGNYFWTHYFFVLLQATYDFPVWFKLNKVPVFLYFVTHAYFMSYHAFTSPVLRRCKFLFSSNFTRVVGMTVVVIALAYVTAFMETWTIQSVPYYVIKDRYQMYVVGSTFYCLYFIISFPMFLRIDETGDKWPLSRVAIDSFASAMIVFCLCDFWRLIVGGLSVEGVDADRIPFV